MKNKEKRLAALSAHNMNDIMYDFIQEFQRVLSIPKNYGTGDTLSTLDAHTLKYIGANPGVTVTSIAAFWKRTKATISLQVSRLEQQGYVEKERDGHNSLLVHLFLTEKGRIMDRAHARYDDRQYQAFADTLRQSYTTDEIAAFYCILDDYRAFLSAWKGDIADPEPGHEDPGA